MQAPCGDTTRPEQLAQWVTAQHRLFSLQQQQLHSYCTELFGYFCLIESLSENNGLNAACRQQNCIQLACNWPQQQAGAEEFSLLYTDPLRLPLPDNCIDLVIIHHLLEVVANPHQLVRQAARVVLPEGRLILFGSNPISPSGAGYLTRRMLKRGWRNHMPLARRICDWLKLLDFTDFRVSYQYPLLHRSSSASNSRRLMQISHKVLLPVNGGWCVMATKHKMAKIMPNPLTSRPHLARLRAQAARRNQL